MGQTVTIFRLKRHSCKRTGGGWCDYQGHIIGIDKDVRLTSLEGVEILLHEIIEAIDVNEFGCKLQHSQVDRLAQVCSQNIKRRFVLEERDR